jgi:hypothetical protein
VRVRIVIDAEMPDDDCLTLPGALATLREEYPSIGALVCDLDGSRAHVQLSRGSEAVSGGWRT